MKIIVGLGNIGKDYERTRHNAGFMALDVIARGFGFDAFRHEDKFEAEIAEGGIGGEKVILVKPQTFMNASGRAASKVLCFYKQGPQDLLVLHDDLDIPLGEYRASFGSRSAGHKGVQSIIDCVGTQDFKRLRIGIKIPDRKIPTERYVLANFTKEEMGMIEKVIASFPEAIEKELI
jgi:PTH1 family peptidyl-tRNA hydrolase